MKRIVALISGGGTNLQALIDACRAGQIEGQIVGVVSNRASAFGLERATKAGIKTVHRPFAPFKTLPDARIDYDAALALDVMAFEPDLVVLAGWMRILSGAFLRPLKGKVINLHPALPGELPGLRAIERAWEEWIEGTRTRTGIMIHEAIEEIDAGPVLGTVEIPFAPGDTPETMEARIHAAEHRLIVEVVARLCADQALSEGLSLGSRKR